MPRFAWCLFALLGIACESPEDLRQAATLARAEGKTEVATRLLTRAIVRQPVIGRDERVAGAALRRELGALRLSVDDPVGGERLYREALNLLETEPRGAATAIINLRTQLAGLCYRQARQEEAAELYRTVLNLEIASLGADHPDTLGTMSVLGGLELKRGRWAVAETLFRDQLAGIRRLHGAEKREVASVRENLADVLERAGRGAEAAQERAEAARIRKLLCDEC